MMAAGILCLVLSIYSWIEDYPKPAIFLGINDPLYQETTGLYYKCFYRRSVYIPSVSDGWLGNYNCPMDGNLNLLTFAGLGLLVGGIVVRLRKS
jgi:hypothetical protein